MNKKSILILGATGMAGHMIYRYLEQSGAYKIYNVVYRTPLNSESIVVDVNDKSKLKNVLEDLKPDYIINCVGILIKGSADHENAIYINSYLPHFLKNTGDKIGARLIHLSTDCVFSGVDGAYSEDSFRDADDIYGRSKALGEVMDANHLTIRTSIIGPELKENGEGLLHWLLLQRGEITGYENAIWSGITTLELAKFIHFYIQNETISDLIHLTNGVPISKFDLLRLIKEIGNLTEITVNRGAAAKTVDKSLISTKAMNYEVPSYQKMIEEMIDWMENNRQDYEIYKY